MTTLLGIDRRLVPEIVLSQTTPDKAGQYAFGCYANDLDITRYSFMLLHRGRLLYYVSVPDGYSWEEVRCRD